MSKTGALHQSHGHAVRRLKLQTPQSTNTIAMYNHCKQRAATTSTRPLPPTGRGKTKGDY